MASTAKIDIDIVLKNQQRIDQLEKSLGRVSQSTFNLGSAAKVAAAGLAAIGTSKLLTGFVRVGSEVENLSVRFKFLFGSAEEGGAAFQALTKYASTVPFSLEQISAASGNLAVVSNGAQELSKNLQLAGNIAAVTGLDFKTTGEQLQRALSGGIAAADLLRERGVGSLLGFQQGAKVSVAETAEALNREFGPGGRFGDAAKTLANTFTGATSMLGDKFYNFQRVVGEEFVTALRMQLGELDVALNSNQETLTAVAQVVGQQLAQASIAVGNALRTLYENSDKVEAALKGVIAVAAGVYFFRLATAIQESAGAFTLLTAAMRANPMIAFVSAIISLITYLNLLDEGTETSSQYQDEYGMILLENTGRVEGQTKATKGLIDQQKELNQLYADLDFATGMGATPDADLQKGYDATVAALLIKEKAFLDQLKVLGEDKLEENLRIERERVAKLEEFKRVDYLNAEKYEAEITRVTADAAAKRAEIYRQETLNRKRETDTILEQIRSGRIKDVDHTKVTEENKKEIVFGAGMSILENLGKVNKKAFQLQKAANIAMAIMNTYTGVTQALKMYPPPISFILAGAQLAFGLAQVSQIRSQQYSGREKGGQVMSGQSYIVGEAGPEVITAGSNGYVTPNNQLMNNSGPLNVTFNINTVDAQGFDALLRSRQGTIIGLINSAMNEKGRRAMV